jgi:L-asparaginase/Glu-tRNA(Gln) amidotransferase subunit D
MKRKVLLIYTGGTIGMEKDYETGSLRALISEIFLKNAGNEADGM